MGSAFSELRIWGLQLSRYIRVGARLQGLYQSEHRARAEAWNSFPEHSFHIPSLKLEVVKREAGEWEEHVFK